MAAKNEIGKFRRSYAAKLCEEYDNDQRRNPLHLKISKRDYSIFKKSADCDETLFCAIRIKREPENSADVSSSSSSGRSTPSPELQGVATSVVISEDIIVCVLAANDSSAVMVPTPISHTHSLSIDEDSDDDVVESGYKIDLKCTEYFSRHYNVKHSDLLYIRAIELFPLNKAIFSVNDEKIYEWLQQDTFSEGLKQEICQHDLLVRQNDVFLAPVAKIFHEDEKFKKTWYFSIKAIASAPFQIGLIKPTTEIVIYFEKANTRLPSEHRHLSGHDIEQYEILMSDFVNQPNSQVFNDDGTDEKNFNFFCSSTNVIQQLIHWKKVLLQDESVDSIDLTSVIGMPKKMMKKYRIFNGTILKVCLYQKELLGEINMNDAEKYLKLEKPKQKFVKVQALTGRLDDTDMVFISSILLFNLQKGPPVIKTPLLIIEKPAANPVIHDFSGSKLSRSVSTQVPFAQEVQITIINSPSYPPQAKHDQSLKKYFQIPRLLGVGDLFAVSSLDDPDFWPTPGLDTRVRKPVIFFRVSGILPKQLDNNVCYVDAVNSTLKQVGSDHSFVPLNACKYLSCLDAIYGQSIVCPGLENYVRKLEYLLLPHIHNKYNAPAIRELMSSVLLSGPKGCGKRTIIYTVARRLHMQVMEINCHDLIGDTSDATDKNLSRLNSVIKYTPCILLLRNIEVIGKDRDGKSDDPRIINTFHKIIQQTVDQCHEYPIIIAGTSSNIASLAEDMLPTFLHEVAIESPNEMERAEIIQGLLDSLVASPDLSISHLAQRTAGFVLGDLITLILQARREAYQKVLKICCADRLPASLQREEDIVTAGVVMEQCDLEKALDTMQASHSDSIGAPKIPSVKWDDIGGLADVKSEIIDTVQLPLQHPELLAAGLRRSGVLLYGPPGTGKTLLAKAVATECSLNFLSVKGPELINMYVGQSEENVREVFKRARSASPCVIFFDELDSLAPNRGKSGDSGGVMDRVVSQLLAELDGLHQSSEVFVIGATNRPDLLDPALLRPGRFDKLLYLGVNSDCQSQLNILKALTSKFKLASGLNLMDVAKKCPPNLTGADLYALCADAMLNAMRRKIEKLELGEDEDQKKLEVDEVDFDSALNTLVPSVSHEDLQKYEQIRASFQP